MQTSQSLQLLQAAEAVPQQGQYDAGAQGPTLRTGRRVVIRRGCCWLSCPSSLAQVSPQQQAK